MDLITVLANFKILLNKDHPRAERVASFIENISTIENDQEHVNTYSITPQSVWNGLMKTDEDILRTLKDYTESKIPENVSTEIKSWVEKNNSIKILDDCLIFKNQELLNNFKQHPLLKQFINNVDDDRKMIQLENFNLVEIKQIVEEEMGYPLQDHKGAHTSFIIEFVHLVDKTEQCYMMRAHDAIEAFKSLYGIHPEFNEENLKEELKLKRDTICKEDIEKYMIINFDKRERDPRKRVFIRALPKIISYIPQEIFRRT